MTTFTNDTLTSERLRGTQVSLLWLPYVVITVVCLSALAVNFWFYHRRRRHQYLRKLEVEETRENVQERRIIVNLAKDKYTTVVFEDNNKFPCSYNSKAVFFANPMQNKGKPDAKVPPCDI